MADDKNKNKKLYEEWEAEFSDNKDVPMTKEEYLKLKGIDEPKRGIRKVGENLKGTIEMIAGDKPKPYKQISKYPHICSGCDKPIPGGSIVWVNGEFIFHDKCFKN